MKKTILFTCLTALLAACSGKSAVTAPDETTVQPVNLILDTDLDRIMMMSVRWL